MRFKSKVKSYDNFTNFFTKLSHLDGKEAVAGYDDTPHPTAEMSYAELAFIHERGTKHIPAREFMTQAFHDELALRNLSADVVRDVVYRKGTSAAKSLGGLSKKMAKLISDSIMSGDFQELSPITIRLKGGNTKPLRDTDNLMNNVLATIESTGEV